MTPPGAAVFVSARTERKCFNPSCCSICKRDHPKCFWQDEFMSGHRVVWVCMGRWLPMHPLQKSLFLPCPALLSGGTCQYSLAQGEIWEVWTNCAQLLKGEGFPQFLSVQKAGHRLALFAPSTCRVQVLLPLALWITAFRIYPQRHQPSDGNDLHLWERCRLEISLSILVMLNCHLWFSESCYLLTICSWCHFLPWRHPTK